METSVPVKLKTNLNTNFIKIIAIAAMTIDHVGTVFSRNTPPFDGSDESPFHSFCYCLTVGMLYTHDIRKYALRLGAFCLDLPTILDPGFSRR